MIRLLSAAQMKQCDNYTIENVGIPSRELMQRAAEAAFREIMSGGFDLDKVVCICGCGNNGGDGLAVAMLLHKAGVQTEFFVCGSVEKMSEECEYRYYSLLTAGATEQESLDLDGATLVVDAILGIGLTGDVRGAAADAITQVNESLVPVVALDIPSGINSDTGAVMGCALSAELTVSFARLKPGHILYPGRSCCGKTIVADIGIDECGISADELVMGIPEKIDIRFLLPKRAPHSHKGTYGRLLVAAGSRGMCGAAYFAALAAYRAGAGLVELFTPDVNVPVLQGKIPEAIVTSSDEGGAQLFRQRLKDCSACVIGPGLGQSIDAVRLVEEALESDTPLVIDADAMNIIAANDDFKERLKSRKAESVITPHAGEMSRFTGKSIAEVMADPITTARDISHEYGVVCVMKNSATVVASGDCVFVNPTGCSALAKGGSGDVLAGIIGAFLAEGAHGTDAAAAGVYLHGLAGEIAAEELSEYSVLATDTANSISKALKKIL